MRRLAFMLLVVASVVDVDSLAQAPKKKPAPAPVPCTIDGSVTHWMADYCMATLQTDDEIPTSYCVKEETEVKYPDECSAKRFYKRRLCELAVTQHARKGNVDDCVDDRSFMGRSVRSAPDGSRHPR